MDRITDTPAALLAPHTSAGMARAAQMLAAPHVLAGSAVPAAGPAFSTVLADAIQGVQQAQAHASGLQRAYQQGAPEVGIEETMIAMNKASISFQMLAQARNRVVAAYSEIMNMQL